MPLKQLCISGTYRTRRCVSQSKWRSLLGSTKPNTIFFSTIQYSKSVYYTTNVDGTLPEHEKVALNLLIKEISSLQNPPYGFKCLSISLRSGCFDRSYKKFDIDTTGFDGVIDYLKSLLALESNTQDECIVLATEAKPFRGTYCP